MNKKISKSISQKIINKEDLFRLSNLTFNEYKKSKSEHKKFNITINCENNEVYKFENINLKKDESVLDLKRILHLSFSFTDYINNKGIAINLSQGNDNWNNNYVVEGDKESWVNSTNQKIQDILDSIRPQNNLFAKSKRVLFHILSINFGFLFLKILFILLDKFGYKPGDSYQSNPFVFLMDKIIDIFPFLKYILLALISWAFGACILILFWDKLEIYLEDLWPSIEFDFGPEHKKYPKNKRKAIAVIISLIIIPLILQLIFLFI